MGIEPTWLAWKARALPLSYARWNGVAARVANGNYRLPGDNQTSATVSKPRIFGSLSCLCEPFGCAQDKLREAIFPFSQEIASSLRPSQ